MWNIDIFEMVECLYPPGGIRNGYILQRLNLTLDAGGAPFVGVIHNGAILIELKNITAIYLEKFSNWLQSSNYAIVDFVGGQVDEVLWGNSDEFFQFNPVL